MSEAPSSLADVKRVLEEERRSGCRCKQPVRNPHLKPIGDHDRCARCLRALTGDAFHRAKHPHELKRVHGTSAHRQARIEKFTAEQKRKAEKRKRAKRNRS